MGCKSCHLLKSFYTCAYHYVSSYKTRKMDSDFQADIQMRLSDLRLLLNSWNSKFHFSIEYNGSSLDSLENERRDENQEEIDSRLVVPAAPEVCECTCVCYNPNIDHFYDSFLPFQLFGPSEPLKIQSLRAQFMWSFLFSILTLFLLRQMCEKTQSMPRLFFTFPVNAGRVCLSDRCR